MEKLFITPRTKIYDLLEAYPELEDVLISLVAEFKRLKNPVLRKTIARVTNLSQAAVIGGLDVEQLVNQLRKKVGQGSIEQLEADGSNYVTSCPEWFRKEAVVKTIDIREMLSRGEQPLHEVLSSIKVLGGGEILEIIAPFVPAPLLDKSISIGCRHWLEKRTDEEFRIYFTAQ